MTLPFEGSSGALCGGGQKGSVSVTVLGLQGIVTPGACYSVGGSVTSGLVANLKRPVIDIVGPMAENRMTASPAIP